MPHSEPQLLYMTSELYIYLEQEFQSFGHEKSEAKMAAIQSNSSEGHKQFLNSIFSNGPYR
jgi:hypothetical protein